MNLTTSDTVANTAVDLVKNEKVLNKSVDVLGMLFTSIGLEQQAVEMYVEDIEKSDLSDATKVFMVLGIRH